MAAGGWWSSYGGGARCSRQQLRGATGIAGVAAPAWRGTSFLAAAARLQRGGPGGDSAGAGPGALQLSSAQHAAGGGSPGGPAAKWA